ncbi:hypothetical protein IKE72_02115 [Candidatus Saccharibacteria bacterium]|nr:hypothetical protein [Candidatus Saccharibacteria bacterium]
MNIFISGISGTGMGPLALMARQAGHTVWGTDLAKGAIYNELIDAGIEVHIGPQDGEFLKEKITEVAREVTASKIAENTKTTDERTASKITEKAPIWYVHTSALPADNPELQLAKDQHLRVTKRDELTSYLIKELNLKMVAVAGTHGKTTTTSMITYASLRLHLPVSYIVGTTLGFAPSGAFHQGDKFFIYEADEYDRNFLKFHPWISVITCATYDHPDIYPTRADYEQAFAQFRAQSESVIDTSAITDTDFHLAGEVRRRDAALARAAIIRMLGGEERKEEITAALNDYPGVGRRFERIADGVYTDYAHHPEEISATINIAREEAELRGKKGVVVVYQPHQNTRQHEVREGYKDAFTGAEHIYWLPTYLTRENPDLPILTPADLISGLSNSDHAEPAELDDALAVKLKKYVAEGYLVLLMTAGPADTWLRSEFSS